MNERKEALILAIQNEIKAQNLYLMMARAFSDDDSRQTFLGLVPMEEMHEDKLTEIYRAEFDDEPDLDRNALPQFKARRDLKDPKHILQFAVDQELIAHASYKKLAGLAQHDDMRTLFEGLAEEELQHKALLEDRLEQIQGLMTWFDPSELNGLMED